MLCLNESTKQNKDQDAKIMSSLFKITTLCALSAALFTGCASTSPSNEVVRAVTVNAVTAQGVGQEIGTVLLSDSPAGLVIRTNLKQLPAGERGFHIHENGSCVPAMTRSSAVSSICSTVGFNT